MSSLGSVSSLGSQESLGSWASADADARSIRSAISITDPLTGRSDHRLAAWRQPTGNAGDDVGSASRRTSVWSADSRSSHADRRADASERASLGSSFDAARTFDDVSSLGRGSVASRDSMLWDVGRATVELPRLGRGRGGSESHAPRLSSDAPSHASRTHVGLASRFQSAIHRMFQGIYNLIRHGGGHKVAGTAALPTGTPRVVEQLYGSPYAMDAATQTEDSANGAPSIVCSLYSSSTPPSALDEVLARARGRLLDALPRLESLLEGAIAPTGHLDFRNDFLQVAVAVGDFMDLATEGVRNGLVPETVAEKFQALGSNGFVVADGETMSQLWDRMRFGPGGDYSFLGNAATRTGLLAYCSQVREAVKDYGYATNDDQLAWAFEVPLT